MSLPREIHFGPVSTRLHEENVPARMLITATARPIGNAANQRMVFHGGAVPSPITSKHILPIRGSWHVLTYIGRPLHQKEKIISQRERDASPDVHIFWFQPPDRLVALPPSSVKEKNENQAFVSDRRKIDERIQHLSHDLIQPVAKHRLDLSN